MVATKAPVRVVIVGGGVIGSSTAYALKANGGDGVHVTVVERDPTYARASSSLSGSNIRLQFSTPVNIEISRYGIDFLRRAEDLLAVGDDKPALSFKQRGYLYLAGTPDQAAVLRANNAVQRALGAEIALLTPAELVQRYPWLKVEDLELASLGLEAGEGWFDGPGLLQAFRRKARAFGADYVTGEARRFVAAGRQVTGVVLDGGRVLPCDWVVNAAGAWARPLARDLGIDLPVYARRRNVFVFSCPTPLPHCPLIIDTTGLWMRPEGDRYIAGISPPESEDADDLPLDVRHEEFEEIIWPTLAARIPAFEQIRLHGSWAGYYEINTFDYNAIVGPHPAFENAIFANGFSGHGMQQSPAIGRGLAELILHGGFRSIDLAPLGFDRLLRNEPLLELNVI